MPVPTIAAVRSDSPPSKLMPDCGHRLARRDDGELRDAIERRERAFVEMLRLGSKSLTSATTSLRRSSGGTGVGWPMPLLPAFRLDQYVGVSRPTGETTPQPVTTTRCGHFTPWRPPASFVHQLLDRLDDVADGREIGGGAVGVVGDLNAELLFEVEDHFEGVDGFQAQFLKVVGEPSSSFFSPGTFLAMIAITSASHIGHVSAPPVPSGRAPALCYPPLSPFSRASTRFLRSSTFG